jgi:hypothetical protein
MAIGILCSFPACQPENNVPTPDLKTTPNQKSGDETLIVLGKKLKNPYIVEMMQIAYKEARGIDITLRATHLYVRFLPESHLATEPLMRRDSLDVFDYPLDYELKTDGDYYHDPTIALDKVTWLYAVVKPDYIPTSGMAYEVLAQLYLPGDQEEDVEDKALELTGNQESMEKANKAAQRYRPAGRILLRDSELGDVPARNIKVRARRWFKIGTTHTDINGNFRIDVRYRNKVKIFLIFKNDHATIASIRTFSILLLSIR